MNETTAPTNRRNGSAPQHAEHQKTWGEVLRRAAVATAFGVAIGLFIDLGGGRISVLNPVLCGSIGLIIYLLAAFLFAPAWTRIDQMRGLRKAGSVAILLFACGALAWIAVIGGTALFAPHVVNLSAKNMLVSIAFTGAVAILVGSGFFAYETLLDRLHNSVARLKDAEFAAKELELARQIQRRLLPPEEIEGPGYRVAARNLPAHVVAGDFYDVIRLDGGTVGLVVADVVGKGVGASLITAGVKARLPLVDATGGVEAMLSELNDRLGAELGPREFVALCLIRYDPSSGRAVVANAGLPDPYVIRTGHPPEPVSAPGPRLPLGVRKGVLYRSVETRLEPGDRLLLISDGPPEATGLDGNPLGYELVEQLLEDTPGQDPSVWLDSWLENLRQRSTGALDDDWTALVLERTPVIDL